LITGVMRWWCNARETILKALVLHSADGPTSAVLDDIDTPGPAAGEVLVRLEAASLNHRELWISRGLYPGMALPTVLGADGAGRIEAVGAGVDASLIGRDVVLYPGLRWGNDERFPSSDFGLLGMPGPGTIAEAICIPAENAFARPGHLSAIEAASLPVAGLTAYRALAVKAKLAPGERVLITGIGGGVATFGLLFAKAMGAKIWVTSGSPGTIAKAVEQGAEGGFNYRDEHWGKALRSIGGIDVVLDGAPASSFPAYIRNLAMGARVAVYGSTGGPAFSASAPDLFLKHATLLGTAMGTPADFGAMLGFVTEHHLRPVIDRVFDLRDAESALGHLENGHGFGKVAIRIGNSV
jgi:zinc-binding alcohol dehydrogenase/oxidoreductase